MCGISGFFSTSALPEAGRLLQRMNDALAHRGPDDAGYWLCTNSQTTAYVDGNSHPHWQARLARIAPELPAQTGMAHRRLSIIDLSSDGHQPMELGERYVLSFNGEIYNYLELRQQLQSAGMQFHTATDVEVLLQVWAKHGMAGLQLLEGMWAFALYDKQEGRMYLVRDRVGVKPLYYTSHSDRLFFASEPKALLAAGVCSTQLNEAALYAFLMHGAYEETEGSLLLDLQEVPPGHCLQLDSWGNRKLLAYHQPQWSDGWADAPPSPSVLSSINAHLERSVQLRLRSDVKVGASLSGGLDSSVLSLLAAKAPQFPLFTASYSAFEGDESPYASLLAEQVKAHWHQVSLESHHIADQLEKLVTTMDGPLLAFSTFAQHEIYRTAKKTGVTILLDGQGGDELFSGYDRYWTGYQLQALKERKLGTFSPHPQSGLQYHTVIKTWLREKISHYLSLPGQEWLLRLRLRTSKLEYSLLNENFIEQQLAVSASRAAKRIPAGLNEQLAQERYGTTLKNLLRWGDRNSMAFGMENRAPLADDPQLDALLLNLPANWKMHPQYGSKWLFKQVLANQLPQAIAQRKDKVGFSAPSQKWMNELWPQWQYYTRHLSPWVNLEELHKRSNELLQTEWGCLYLLRLVSLGAWIKQLQVFKNA